MSSTSRGGVRQVSDYYITPQAPIHSFLDAMVTQCGVGFLDGGRILDPCAGGEPEHPPAYPTALAARGVRRQDITTIDHRADSGAEIVRDFLTYQPRVPFRFIVSNPPFAIALPFIQHSLSILDHGGWVAFLCRLNFLGSQKRLPFFKKFMPRYVFVHSRRIGFSIPGRRSKATDSIEYAHFVWQKDIYPDAARLFVID